jgi:hypothetical protein
MRFYLLRQEEEDIQMKELNEGTRSMFRSSSIPLAVRFLVPIVILINVGLFLSGHISLGASVDIIAQIGGESFKVKEVFVFSMAESVMDMWEAGAKVSLSRINEEYPTNVMRLINICIYTCRN